jgi:hypothetical protein
VLERHIAAAGHPKPLNVVLVSIESLGADYVESFGGRKGLTPNLNRLAAQGMMFTDVYATGLRTVRGLEALTLSIPPTPGHAVPMRKNNKGFQTIGGVFRDNGYESLYLYGGYSYFDNMNDFFGGNGYTVIDRTAIAKENITHENVWGVADEDLFRQAIRGHGLPKYLRSDHDPLYRFQQWQANLRVLEVTEIKTVPYVPLSHPFVERLIGTVRREYLDRTLFWTTADLETKLFDFQHYYNGHRAHSGLEGGLPEPGIDSSASPIDFDSFTWRRHCRALYQTPIAA